MVRGGISYPIIGNTQIPPYSTIVPISKLMYLVEGDSLRANSNIVSAISITASYETIS
jgi:hypothetical protein